METKGTRAGKLLIDRRLQYSRMAVLLKLDWSAET